MIPGLCLYLCPRLCPRLCLDSAPGSQDFVFVLTDSRNQEIFWEARSCKKTSFSKFPQKTKRQSAFQPEWAEYELYIITGYKKHWCQNILIFTYFPISIFISYNHLFFSKIYLLYIYINNYYMIVVKTNDCWLIYSAIFKYLTIRHIKLPTRKSHLHR